jgi:hypothetical protein
VFLFLLFFFFSWNWFFFIKFCCKNLNEIDPFHVCVNCF